jgi:hypothetical protein
MKKASPLYSTFVSLSTLIELTVLQLLPEFHFFENHFKIDPLLPMNCTDFSSN